MPAPIPGPFILTLPFWEMFFQLLIMKLFFKIENFIYFAVEMRENHPIISIGRSFGAGGRAIGRQLSALTGFPFFDNELLIETAQQYGFSRELFMRVDEKRPSMFKRLVTQIYGVQETYQAETISPENLYQAQSRVIRAIASKGPCIIIGRTADYILRDYPGLVKIFFHAPVAFRAAKIMERGDASNEIDAIEMARLKDKRRQEYYNYFTGRNWGSASNYDLTLDSSLLTPEGNAEVILKFMTELFRRQGLPEFSSFIVDS